MMGIVLLITALIAAGAAIFLLASTKQTGNGQRQGWSQRFSAVLLLAASGYLMYGQFDALQAFFVWLGVISVAATIAVFLTPFIQSRT